MSDQLTSRADGNPLAGKGDMFAALVQQFRQMSRVLQGGVIAMAGIALYLVYDQTLQPVANDLNASSEAIQNKVAQLVAAQKVTHRFQDRDVRDVVSALGPVKVPPPENKGKAAFNDVVNQLLEKYHASNASFGFRSKGRLSKTSLPEITPADGRIDRLSGELKFDATPADALAIIAELESSPDVESVSSVKLIRDTAPKIKVNLTIETWVTSSGSAAGPAQAGSQGESL